MIDSGDRSKTVHRKLIGDFNHGLLGQDYEVITADDRLDKIATDFVEHCTTRWESGKSMLVCTDKITCGRMYHRLVPRWQKKLEAIQAAAVVEKDDAKSAALEAQAKW